MAKGSSIKAYFSLLTHLPANLCLELPEKFTNKNKNYAHHLSRYALSVVINKQIEFTKIELLNFQRVSDYPLSIFSVAHTSISNNKAHSKNAALALRGSETDFYGLGCDIESLDRPVPENSHKFFINQYDTYPGNLLEIWCLKEACFKALSNSGAPIKLLKEVVLSQNSFRYINDKDFSSKNCFKLLRNDQFLFVLAFCAKLEQELTLVEVASELK